MGELVDVGDTRVYVDRRGDAAGPSLLYVHGGPGNSCYDFMESVGDRLAQAGLDVIGVDQRGVLRSDPLPQDPPLTVDLLVADFEAVRRALDIRTWAILGHSSGGAYAIDYAVSHPESVRRLILDCPAVDADATDRYRLPVAADLLERAGKADAAARCREVAELPRRITAADKSWEPMQQLGNEYLNLFMHDPTHVRAYQQLAEDSGFTQEQWMKGVSHLPLLEDAYHDRRPLLSQLSMPALLVRGASDLVAAPDIVDAFSRKVAGSQVATLEGSGHFPFVEQPDAYTRAVADFVLAGTGTT